MTAPLAVIAVLIVSACTRINAVVLGQHVSVPVIGLVFAAAVLALAALVLALIRSIVRDRHFLYLRPTVVNQ